MDVLALEIQRSLDYYESYYGLPTLGSLVVAPLTRHTQQLVDRLNQSLGVICRAMDASALVHCREPLEDAIQQAALPAIGVLLRGAPA
jgi:MSHA biogenesis protein MshI